MASKVRSPMRVVSPLQPSTPAPRPKFDPDLLKAYMRKLISTTLQGQSWDSKNREQQKAWCKEIGERVKARMLEIQPTGFKFVVTTIINENRGQGGRADMVCHWEDSDVVAQEMWANDSLICICLAYAIQTA